jgi:biotin carboxylase
VNNYIKIMALEETAIHGVSLVSAREEAGINTIYDPARDAEQYQVFIHSRFPFESTDSKIFDTFAEARSYAAKTFNEGWEVLSWNFKTKRPCEEEGVECGSRNCDTCKAMAAEGGKSACSGCGVLDD